MDSLPSRRITSLTGDDSWALLNGDNIDLDADQIFWRRRVGIPLATLLSKARYPVTLQYRALQFFFTEVMPELGAGPGHAGNCQMWRSFMTDDFSPVELSWEWGLQGTAPTIRFAFEPIGPYAGSSLDPLNQHSALRMARRTNEIMQGCNLDWFNEFLRTISFELPLADLLESGQKQGHESRLFLGFDIFEQLIMKAYFLPASRAAELKISSWELISAVITNLQMYRDSALQSFDLLRDFVDSLDASTRLIPEIVAIDCVEPIYSRIKIYMRSSSTSFQSVQRTMTLSKHPDPIDKPPAGVRRLRRLWYLTFGLSPDFPEAANLPLKNHRTAGILYYFELRPGQQEPRVKVYLPVRHYAPNDFVVADGLRKFHQMEGNEDRHSDFLSALQSIRSLEALKKHRGVQTYIGCCVVGDEVKITSYISPLAFSHVV